MRAHLVALALAVAACASGPEATGSVLVAASNMQHPPFSSWGEDGRAVGLEVDIVEAAARALSREVRWVERPFAELLDAVAAGEVDVAVSTIGITAERAERVGFSEPYYETVIVALVRPGFGGPTSLADLAHARIGADRSTTSYTAARATWPYASLVGAADEGSSWPAMVASGRIQAFVVDASDQARLEAASGVTLRRLGEPLAAESFAVAYTPGDAALGAALDAAVAERAAASD